MSFEYSWFDSDPYTGIAISEGGDVVCKLRIANSYDGFEDFLKTKPKPDSKESAIALVREFEQTEDEFSDAFIARITAELKKLD